MSPVGGLSHQGKIDPDQPAEKSKQVRDPKRRTVQVEYVAPQSETARGEITPSVQSPSTIESPAAGISSIPSKGPAKAGSDAFNQSSRQATIASTSSKPLPQEPYAIQTSGSSRYQRQPSDVKAQSGLGISQAMGPPARVPKDIPRSASDSANAFGYSNTSTVIRPNTSGSMTSGGQGRLPSRGNSYSQPLAPTVAATNAQGRLAQPKNGKQYIISAPIPQAEPYFAEDSIGRPSTQHANQAATVGSSREPVKSHKRSNTLGNVFSRSGSFFGGKSQGSSPQEQTRQAQDKRYPPTSMKNPIASDSPRQSIESRRSTSFGFGRKSSDLRKNPDLSKQEKPRRFSILPASFSLKNLTGASRDQPDDDVLPVSERRPSTMAHQVPPSRGQSRPQTMGTARAQNQASIYQKEDNLSGAYDGQREQIRANSSQQNRGDNTSYQATPYTQPSAYGNPQYSNQPGGYGPSRRPLPTGQSYLLGESGTPTESEISVGASQHRPVYPPGFNSQEEIPQVSTQQNRNARVLQKNNRKFADAYDQEQEPGYGNGGHHAGSSGAAKRVMEFFRRRGKARAGDDRV